MPKTGGKAPKSGIYKCPKCGEKIKNIAGNKIPPCPKCHKSVNSSFVRSI